MADSQIASLFMTPEMYQQDQSNQALARATQFAQLDPLQRAAQSMYYGGYQAGNAIAGALGGQDPMLAQLTAVQKLGTQFDLSSSQGNLQMAKALQDQGMAGAAAQFAAKAAALRKDEASAMPEKQRLAMSMADTKAQRGTKEWISAYQESLGEVINPEKLSTNEKDYNAAVKGGYKGTFQEWLDHKTLLGRNVNNINMPAAEKAFDVKLAELDAKTVDDARKMRDTSISAIKSLNQLASLPDNQLIGGAFAEGRVGATNLLATLGLASGADLNKLAKSQQYQKTAGDVVLQTLGGKLGTGFSNEDRKFIVGLVPQLETSPQARRELITFMQNKNQDIVNETLRLEKYAREKKGLSGFDYKIPMSVTPSVASGMTDEQLKAIAGIK